MTLPHHGQHPASTLRSLTLADVGFTIADFRLAIEAREVSRARQYVEGEEPVWDGKKEESISMTGEMVDEGAETSEGRSGGRTKREKEKEKGKGKSEYLKNLTEIIGRP